MAIQNPNELQHYGVLGMKWGVHRGRTEQAYEKVVSKKNKLMTKSEKHRLKSNKLMDKASKRYLTEIDRGLSQSRSFKAAKELKKAKKFEKKAAKLQKSIDEIFSSESGKKTVSEGKQVIEKMLNE